MDIKEKMKIQRQKMPEQPALHRRCNNDEVTLGYSVETAQLEAHRCLQCKKPLCKEGCPVCIDIPDFIALIAEGKFTEATQKIKEKNSLPSVTGRVCPQESQCEGQCILGKKGEPVAIGRLERFAADYVRKMKTSTLPTLPPPTGKHIAVIGSGPAGLTVAGDLLKHGHRVTIFEALHEPGGVLMYGIPEFRLPKEIVLSEIEYLAKLGADIKQDYVIGQTDTVDELLQNGFDAVFIGSGAGLPTFMGVPGENLSGVYSANEYLTRANLMKSYKFPDFGTVPIQGKIVIVVGGGNVAMDAARTAIRFGAKTFIVYRRSREEMPARVEEVHHAEEEGVIFNFLTNPTQVLGNNDGKVIGIQCIRMELGEADASGRRKPVPVKGSEFVIECDTVIPALGNKPNPLIPQTTSHLNISKWGTVVVDEKTMATSKPGVFAGGDIVSGAATVILAMGQARIAAQSIHEYVMQQK